jgi:hypothetical protein
MKKQSAKYDISFSGRGNGRLCTAKISSPSYCRFTRFSSGSFRNSMFMLYSAQDKLGNRAVIAEFFAWRAQTRRRPALVEASGPFAGEPAAMSSFSAIVKSRHSLRIVPIERSH